MHRTNAKSIYNRTQQISQDPYDFSKVDLGIIKTTKGTEKKAHYSLKQQTDRNFTKVIQGSVGDAYDNIKRENDRADYIKKLLMSA